VVRGRRIALVLAAVVAVSGCSRSGAHQRAHPTDLVTRTSLGGIHLLDSQATVERLYGPGRNLHRHGERAFHYSAGLTVVYDTDLKGSPVAVVEATSPRFHTVSGARIGGSLRAVKALGHMDCGLVSKATAVSDREVDCVTYAHGPGLMFDLVGGKVVYLALLLRSD
jgi:hypothetical protein